jgi:Secretion system C-terminal sorting domain
MKPELIFAILLFLFASGRVTAQTNTIKIIHPDTGEIINNNNSYEIKWIGGNYDVLFYFSDNDGEKWDNTYTYNYEYGDTNTASWYPPEVISVNCRIKLYFRNDSSEYVSGKFSLYGLDSDTISINNLTMWQINNGLGSFNPTNNSSGLMWNTFTNILYPALSFSDGPLWGGRINGEIRSNGVMYRSGLSPGAKLIQDSLWTGLISDINNYKSFRIWKLRSNPKEIQDSSLLNEYNFNYENWPGELGAPYIEVLNNGRYDESIDQPRVIGDEELFFINNDYDTTVSRMCFGSDPIGIELQTLVFAYKRNNPIDDVIFKKYLMVNKGNNIVEDMYLGFFVDIDLGIPTDDCNGSDSTLGMGFTYNGQPIDEVWGTQPPATGYLLVQGPVIPSVSDSAMINGHYEKDFKNLPLTSFTTYINGSVLYKYPRLGNYEGSIQVYNNMKGLFFNGNPVIDPHTGKVVKFALAGDPESKTGWYDGEGWPGGPGPGQRYWSMGCGPFNFAPGDTQEIVIAIIAARGTDNLNSVTELKNKAEFVKQFYKDEVFPSFKQTYNIPNQFRLYQNYPNPFNASTTIRFSTPIDAIIKINIYDILGRKVKTLLNEQRNAGAYEVNFNAARFSSGVYFYRIEAWGFIQTKKMILLK